MKPSEAKGMERKNNGKKYLCVFYLFLFFGAFFPLRASSEEGPPQEETNLGREKTEAALSEKQLLGPLVSPEKRWEVEVGGGVTDYNFAPAAPDVFFQITYKKENKFYVQGGFDYFDAFGEQAYTFSAGGGYWVLPYLTLSDSISIATNAVIVPRFENSFEIDGVLPHDFVPFLIYNFSSYDGVNVHTINPGISWYFTSWGIWEVDYYLAINNFENHSSGRLDHSFFTKFTFIPWEERLSLFISYGHNEESFDPGDSLVLEKFKSHAVGGGIEWVTVYDIGLRFNVEYENRDNGETLHTYNSSIFYRF